MVSSADGDSNQVVSLDEKGNDLFSSHFPLLSPDATSVIFLQNNSLLYLRELQQNQSTLVTNSAKSATVGHPLAAVFSANSRFLAYAASAGVHVYDRQTQSNIAVCSQCDQ